MSQFCGICLSPVIYHDTKLGINVCSECGAHETAGGWQQRERRRIAREDDTSDRSRETRYLQ